MTGITWHTAWHDSLASRMDSKLGLPAVHANYPADNPDRVKQTTLPGATVTSAFSYVIDIGCVYPDHPYVRDFLTWTIEMGEAMLSDVERWATQWAVLGRAQRSRLEGVLALACGLRDGSEPDRDRLNACRDDAVAAYAEAAGENWDERAQSDYLVAIQFCLIGGNVAGAREMLGAKRRFALTQQWHDWLAAFVRHIAVASNGRVVDAIAVDAFDEFFDRIRDPGFKPAKQKGKWMSVSLPLLRIQLAILRHKYIAGGAISGCWSRILLSIAK